MVRQLLILLFLASSWYQTALFAQLNAIAGYDIMQPGLDQFNSLVRTFNAAHPETELAPRPIQALNGFITGLRYGHEFGAFEVFYRRNLTRRRGNEYLLTASGTDGIERLVDVDRVDLSYAISAVSLNLEFGKGIIIGGSIDYNIFAQKMTYRGTGANEFRNFKNSEHTWGNRIFIGLHVRNSSRLSFSLRPYYQWYWSTLANSALRDKLGGPTESCLPCRERPRSFGLSIIINNGPQT
jgi:hypothetical protein